LLIRSLTTSTLFPYTTLFRSDLDNSTHPGDTNGCVPASVANSMTWLATQHPLGIPDLRDAFDQLSNLMNRLAGQGATTSEMVRADRKSTRLNSSHQIISYAVF